MTMWERFWQVRRWVIPSLIVVLHIGSCAATDFMTEEERIAYGRLQNEYEALLQAAEQDDEEIKLLRTQLDLLAQQYSDGMENPEELIAKLTELEREIIMRETQRRSLDEELQRLDAEMEAAERASIEDETTLLGSVVGAVYPPAKGLSNMWSLLYFLLPRPRDNLFKGIGKVGKGFKQLTRLDPKGFVTIGSAVRSMVAILGGAHTSHDPESLLKTTMKLAEKRNSELVVLDGKPAIAPKPEGEKKAA